MAEAADDFPEDAFALLSDGTRLAILRELVDAADEARTPRPEPTAFSTLRDRVGVRDSGNFNYHLNALRGRFVRKVDGGYRATRAGRDVVRAVRAGDTAVGDALPETRLDERCPYCGAGVAAFVEDDWLFAVCTGCDGAFAGMERAPDGLLSAQEVPPAAQQGRDLSALFEAVHASAKRRIQTTIDGVCPECVGVVALALDVCEAHEGDGRSCSQCGRPSPAVVHAECEGCGYVGGFDPAAALWSHPAVVAATHEADAVRDASTWRAMTEPVTWGCEVETGEGTLRYRVPDGEGALLVTVDADLDVVAVERDDGRA